MIETKSHLKTVLLIGLLVSTVCMSIVSGNVFQSSSMLLEVKEPLQILGYPSMISLFPGEAQEFSVQVKNQASVNYLCTLECHLNDTAYESNYVVFSSKNYTVTPGVQALITSLSVSANAPPGNFLLTVLVKRESGEEQSSPSPSPEGLLLSPSLALLAGGARWTAGNGNSALFVNTKDNWAAHHLTDGIDWGPWWPEENLDNSRSVISQTLQQAGFDVVYAADIPQSLNGYDLVFVEAFWAVEPRHNALFRDYIADGGGVVIFGGVPCYFSVYCKDFWPYRLGGMDLTSLQDWFGCRYFVNTGGRARATVNNPFGCEILANDTLVTGQGGSSSAVLSPVSGAQVIGLWDAPVSSPQVPGSWGAAPIFTFTNEYGQGRVYYQAAY